MRRGEVDRASQAGCFLCATGNDVVLTKRATSPVAEQAQIGIPCSIASVGRWRLGPVWTITRRKLGCGCSMDIDDRGRSG